MPGADSRPTPRKSAGQNPTNSFSARTRQGPSSRLGPWSPECKVAHSGLCAPPTCTVPAEGEVNVRTSPLFLTSILLTAGLVASEAGAQSPTTSTFIPTGSMSVPRDGHTATLLTTGKVLIAGGANSSGDLSTAELYDPASGTFTLIANLMTSPHAGHTATVLPNGKVLIAGGFDGLGRPSTTAELYDPSQGTFSQTSPMLTGRSSHTATLLPSGKVLIAGGFGFAESTAELYDPNTGIFTVTGRMQVPRLWHTATLLPDGRVLITGGFNDFGGSTAPEASAEVYNPTTGIFTLLASIMSAPRALHTATALSNGRILLVGGTRIVNFGQRLAQNSADVFDPATNTFASTGSMTTARFQHTATLLPNGQVVVAGGNDGVNVFNTAEIFDSATGLFSPTGSMAFLRSSHSATLLPNGNVLVAGGSGGFVVGFLASAEIYIPTPSPGRFAYVANCGPSCGTSGPDGNVSAYTIDGATGALTPVAGSPFPAGSNPRSVTVDPTGRFAYVANFFSGNVSGYIIDGTTGALTPVAGSPFLAGGTPFTVTVDPTSRFAYVANQFSNNVSAYTIDGSTGALTPVAGSPFSAGGIAPRSVTVHPTGQFAYVTASDSVSAYRINQATGALTPVAGSPFPGVMDPISVTVDPTGRFAYVANFSFQNVSAYTIDG